MIINDSKLASFQDMIRRFADRNDLHYSLFTNVDKSVTEVKLGTVYRYHTYIVKWAEVPSLSDAAATVYANAIDEFRLKDSVDRKDPAFDIKKVIFSNPATIVLWEDGTKTVVKCQYGDIYDEHTGLALCIAKKALGNKSNFNNVFKKWIPETERYNVVFKNIDIPFDDPYSNKTIGSFVDKMRHIFGGENA